MIPGPHQVERHRDGIDAIGGEISHQALEPAADSQQIAALVGRGLQHPALRLGEEGLASVNTFVFGYSDQARHDTLDGQANRLWVHIAQRLDTDLVAKIYRCLTRPCA